MTSDGSAERRANMAKMIADNPGLAPSGVVEIGYMLRDYLANAVADADTHVDTGCGFGEFDCCVKVGGEEYWVTVKKGGAAPDDFGVITLTEGQ